VKAECRPGLLAVQHVSLSVVDVAEALTFYSDVVGFDVLPRPDFGVAGAWLVTGNGVQIHLIEDPDFEAPAGPHFALETTDIDSEVTRLRARGVDVGDAFELNGVQQAFFYDPSGNQIELNQPAAPAP
jgi:catechol 2,3-dioxygenase-like lactoylglutathione lyase family enzyme